MADTGLDLISQVIPAMFIVLALPLGVYWWSRRGRIGSTNRLRVSDKAAFGKNTWVAVVEIDGRRFLVGAGERGVSNISELDPEPESEPETIGTDATPITERPGIGLVRRLQLITLRSSERTDRQAVRGIPH